MRKIITALSAIFLVLLIAMSVVACVKEESQESVKTGKDYVVLNTYEITLYEGETATLSALKYAIDGTALNIEKISFNSDAAKVASVDGSGLITAIKNGTTNINVNVDGIKAACFVTVKRGDLLNGAVIGFTESNLYEGLPSQANVSLYEEGQIVYSPKADEVTWSVSDETIATITADGKVTAKPLGVDADGKSVLTKDITVKATFNYDGKSVSAEKTIAIIKPYFYGVDDSLVELASTVTLSGKTNDRHITTTVSTFKINVTDSSDKVEFKDSSKITVESLDEKVVKAEVGENGKIIITAVAAGESGLRVAIDDETRPVVVKVKIYMAISSIEDMDILAIACNNNVSLLSGDYVLVNDIDYNGEVILPIATFNDEVNSRTVGMQWRYWLTSRGDGVYDLISRENFGKLDSKYLTEDQFVALGTRRGINGENVSAFTGIFDGNGYSIKNADLFYGSNVATGGYGTFASIFGRFGGTLKNISFENIGQQSPDEVNAKLPEGESINRIIYKYNSYTKKAEKYSPENVLMLKKVNTSAGETYVYSAATLIGRSENAVLENIYFDLNITLCGTSAGAGATFNGGVVARADSGTLIAKNCVVDIEDPNYWKEQSSGNWSRVSAFVWTGNAFEKGIFSNNLVVGSWHFGWLSKDNPLTDKMVGQDGNWFTTATDWKSLFDLNAGASAENVIALNDTISTFDSSVWNMSKFNVANGGAPQLIKGCSMDNNI